MKLEYLKDYYYVIKVYHPKGQAFGLVAYMEWKEMSLNHLSRWRWYFDYRAALLKVQNPKSKVETIVSQAQPSKKTVEHFYRDKIAGKKRMITKISNGIEKHRQWKMNTDIFGIEHDNVIPMAESKLERYKLELIQVEKEFEEFLNQKS